MRHSELDIRILKITEVPGKCHLNRWELMRYAGNENEISVDLHARVDIDSKVDCLSLRLGTVYTYLRSMVKRPLLDFTIEAQFEIPSIDDFVSFNDDHDKVDLPPSLMSLVLSVALGALRGMIAQKTVGTALEYRPLPLVNLSSLVSRLIYGSRPKESTIPFDTQIVM